MRFMMIIRPPAYGPEHADPVEMEAMSRYNDELQAAGVLLDVNGLESTEKGAKVRFKGANRTVIDGPFTEAKEVIGGYWVIQVRSKAEAIEWAKRIPLGTECHKEH